MAELAFREGIMDRIRIREPRFDEQAYLFVLSALEMCQAQLTVRRHITGVELARAARDLALERYGLMARVVLEHWGISSTADIGDIVFTLVDLGRNPRSTSVNTMSPMSAVEEIPQCSSTTRAMSPYRSSARSRAARASSTPVMWRRTVSCAWHISSADRTNRYACSSNRGSRMRIRSMMPSRNASSAICYFFPAIEGKDV